MPEGTFYRINILPAYRKFLETISPFANRFPHRINFIDSQLAAKAKTLRPGNRINQRCFPAKLAHT